MIGSKYISNSGLEFTVIDVFKEYKGRRLWVMWTVMFTETKHVKTVYRENAIAGKVSDPYAKTTYGIGYIGEPEDVPYKEQAKQLWRNMMKRCYSEKDVRGYKGRCFVDARWLCFANFLKDLPSLKNFEKWLMGGECSQTRYQLDKDILGDGTVYSVKTCQFVTERLNKQLGAINARENDPRTLIARSKRVALV